jgi:hypothetical protein
MKSFKKEAVKTLFSNENVYFHEDYFLVFLEQLLKLAAT